MSTGENIFDSLKNGWSVPANHPDRRELRKQSYATISLVHQLNHSSDPDEIRGILAELTGSLIDETVAVFPPIHINLWQESEFR